MREWEARFKAKTGLVNRSKYKIFYGLVHPAPILVLGINPGGKPDEIKPNGMDHFSGIGRAAASTSFYENGEPDLLDCQWRENNIIGLLKPIVEAKDMTIRDDVVKTNMAFHRSPKVQAIDIKRAMNDANQILTELIDFVNPNLTVLAGVSVYEFTSRYCAESNELADRETDAGVNQTVFWPWSIQLKQQPRKSIAVQVAHASQFSWTYKKYDVANRLLRYWK